MSLSSSSSSTPRIIHQTWKSQDIPEHLKDYVTSCRVKNPDYEYRLWTDADLRQIVAESYPQFLKHYDGFAKTIERVDFARYAILHKVGGIYADIDMQCLKSFNVLVALNCPVFGNEPVEHRETLYQNKERIICNALMLSPPQHPVWMAIMNFIVKNYNPQNGPVGNTGPYALTKLYESNPKAFDGCMIYNPCLFYAQSDNMTQKSGIVNETNETIPSISRECSVDDAIAIHRWAHLWIKPKFSQDAKQAQIKQKCKIIIPLVLGLLFVLVALYVWNRHHNK